MLISGYHLPEDYYGEEGVKKELSDKKQTVVLPKPFSVILISSIANSIFSAALATLSVIFMCFAMFSPSASWGE